MSLRLQIEDPDSPEVRALLESSAAYAAGLYPAESNHMLDLQALRRPSVTFVVARLDGHAVGCGAIVRSGEDWVEIKRMFVDPAARGQQVGRRLLEKLEEIARESGATALRLETGIKQPEAIGLYRSPRGFVEDRSVRRLPARSIEHVHGKEMTPARCRTICWTPIWNKDREGVGLEHLLLAERVADSVVLAFDEEHGPFRLTYRLTWDESWRLRDAELVVATERSTRSLSLQTDGQGHWRHGDGRAIDELDGCVDVDIWPTPFTNSFPIRREPMAVGERRQFRMAWIFAPDLTVHPQPQAYTRLADRLYLFENLDGSGFRAELPVDEDGIVLDYPDLFRRVT